MREQLSDQSSEIVSGGKYQLNGNNGKLLFYNDNRVFQLKNCDVYEAIAYLNSMMGQFATDAEYDAACIAGLESKGWVDTIGTY